MKQRRFIIIISVSVSDDPQQHETQSESDIEELNLFGLARISIANNIASELDYSASIDDFANMKARKMEFT